MLLHNFKYTFRILMRQRMLVFWTFAFPLILGFFFNMAFSNIEKAENFSPVDIAVVDDEWFNNDIFTAQALEQMSGKDNEDRIFNIKYVDEDEAKKLLEKNKIAGYLKCVPRQSDVENMLEIDRNIVISKNGTNQTIFKSAIDEIAQTSDLLNTKFEYAIQNGTNTETMEELIAEIYSDISDKREVLLKNVSGDNLSYTVIEFYTLIAMTCLYGGIVGMTAINQSLANTSTNGKRVAMSPSKKSNVVLSSLLAGYTVQLIGIALLFVFSVFVLKVDFGDSLVYIIPLAMAGCLSGLALGIAAGVLIKAGEGAKIGIIIGITMLMSFFSGMMGVKMKYVIDKNVPVINKLNPAAMITDGLYSLYYYDTSERYIFNIVSLLIFSAVMLIISWGGLRRQQYDSI